jgi:hypothetical protein
MCIITDSQIDEMTLLSVLNSKVLKTEYKLAHKVANNHHCWVP